MGFDERDLVRWFLTAGFEATGLAYEVLATRLPKSTDEALQLLDRRGNPTGPTRREAAVAALGPDADRYLRTYVEMHRQPRTSVEALAFLTATRQTDWATP